VTAGAVHEFGMHVNVDGVNVPLVQERDGSDGSYPAAHAVVHSEPDATKAVVQLPPVASFVTVGAVQLFGLHVNVDGVNVPREHANVETLAVCPATHCVTHFDPCRIVEPPTQLGDVAFMIVGAVHGFGLHVNVDGVNVPKLQERLESDAVNPVLHCVVQIEPEAVHETAPPHGVVEFVTLGVAQVFAVHVNVGGEKALRLHAREVTFGT